MSDQPLNLKRSLHILRQHWITVGVVAMLGLLAGAGWVAVNPPMYTGTSLVLLPTSVQNVNTQQVIASSNVVLTEAALSIRPAVSPQVLTGRVQVTTPIAYGLLIIAEGETAAQAVDTANAVADSYVAYVSGARNQGGRIPAQVLQRATSASETWLLGPLLVTGGIGLLAGVLVGAVGALAINRRDRRLRQRDEIADAIGVPVLASVPARHPTNANHWTRLLDEYEPGAADAQRLRNALDYLGLGYLGPGNRGLGDTMSASARPRGCDFTVVSLSSDRAALALGPQLAAFAASQGVLTTLVIDGRPDVSAMAGLRAACSTTPTSRRVGHLQVAVADHDNPDWPAAALTVAVAVVDSGTPQVADTIRTGAMVLGVSAGAATAEQLARVVASAASDGRHIAGILVADPASSDPTTGSVPQLGRRPQTPTRMAGTALVTR
jgi:capsular polysaccharide biosynthesis protein